MLQALLSVTKYRSVLSLTRRGVRLKVTNYLEILCWSHNQIYNEYVLISQVWIYSKSLFRVLPKYTMLSSMSQLKGSQLSLTAGCNLGIKFHNIGCTRFVPIRPLMYLLLSQKDKDMGKETAVVPVQKAHPNFKCIKNGHWILKAIFSFIRWIDLNEFWNTCSFMQITDFFLAELSNKFTWLIGLDKAREAR